MVAFQQHTPFLGQVLPCFSHLNERDALLAIQPGSVLPTVGGVLKLNFLRGRRPHHSVSSPKLTASRCSPLPSAA